MSTIKRFIPFNFVKNNNPSKKYAFTLAEVLITIGVIGVVAAMVMPGIVENVQERILIVKLKQTYSILSNGLKRMTAENGTIDTWGSTAEAREAKLRELMPKYFNVLTYCKKGELGCFGKEYTTHLVDELVGNAGHGLIPVNTYNYSDSVLLANGIAVMYGLTSSNSGNATTYTCSKTVGEYNSDVLNSKESWLETCMIIGVDINGPARPNAASEDWFGFYVVKDGVVPTGTQGSRNWSWVLSFDNACLSKSAFSIPFQTNCTAWVLANGNMDYKRCPEKLGWGSDKAKSCK